MIKKLSGYLLIALALACIATAVRAYLNADGALSIWSVDVLVSAGFHGACMCGAVWLLMPAAARGRS